MERLVQSLSGTEISLKFRSHSDLASKHAAPILSFKKSRNYVPYLSLDLKIAHNSDTSALIQRKRIVDRERCNIEETLQFQKTVEVKVEKFYFDSLMLIGKTKRKTQKPKRRSIISTLSRLVK